MFRDGAPITDKYNIQLPSFEYGDDLFLNLSNEQINELIKILHKSLDLETLKYNLRHFYNKHYIAAKNFDFFYEQFLANIQQRYNETLRENSISISDAIITIINGETSYVIMTLVSILDIVSLSVAAVSTLTIAFGGIALAAGIYLFASEYKERAEEKKATEDEFDLRIMKTVLAESIIYCREKNIRKANYNVYEDYEYLPMPNPEEHHTDYEEPHYLIRFKPAVIKAVMTFTMLLGTYFLGSAIILTAFGATAAALAISGPIGIGIAVGIAVAVSLFILYRQYRATQISNKLVHLQKDMDSGLDMLEENINEHKIISAVSNEADPMPLELNERNSQGHGHNPDHNNNFQTSIRGRFAHRNMPGPKVHPGVGRNLGF